MCCFGSSCHEIEIFLRFLGLFYLALFSYTELSTGAYSVLELSTVTA